MKTADPEGFRGISVFHYFPRFNKFQTSLWRRESHHTTLHMHSPSQPNNLFCGKTLSIKKCQVMGALETWSLLTDMLQASPRAPDSLLCVCFPSCKPERISFSQRLRSTPVESRKRKEMLYSKISRVSRSNPVLSLPTHLAILSQLKNKERREGA